MRHLQPDLLDYLQEKEISGQSSWLFTEHKIEPFVYVDKLFTPSQCKTIIQIGKNAVLDKALVGGENQDDVSFRKSRTSWISPIYGNRWIFQKITDAAIYVNSQFFKFDLFGFVEGIQFAEYASPGGKFDPHIDFMYGGKIRKLTISVQLSDENDYEGGDLVCNYGGEMILPRGQGAAIAYPSYALHGVKPVTKGTRYSLVIWITGPQFK